MRHDTWAAHGGKAGRLPVKGELPAKGPVPTKEDFERDFPGTEARRMTLAEFEACERRIEYWDGDSELVAEVREPTSGAHNSPVESLAALAALISAVRGAPIRTFGHVSLVIRDDFRERLGRLARTG